MTGAVKAGGVGKLGVVVWPSYVGFCTADPGPGPVPYGEPTHPYYKRGQIQWAREVIDGAEQVVGRAFVMVPKTSILVPYTHEAFFSGPEGNCMMGKCQLPQPIPFPVDGKIEVYPIINPDLRINKAQGIDYK